jgi:hypothetical protein
MNSAQAPAATVERLGITQDQLILEVGFDQSDCDQIIRDAITAKTGNKFLDATSQEVVDAVILWWRDGDGDLVDELVDALTYLTEDGPIWLFTPKVGRPVMLNQVTFKMLPPPQVCHKPPHFQLALIGVQLD